MQKRSGRNKKLKVGVLDFFSGCGGVSLGFRAAKVDGVETSIIGGIDIDEWSCLTYENVVGAPCQRVDIRHLVNNQKLFRLQKKRWNTEEFDRLIVVGCAPCQGFAAHRKSISGVDKRRPLLVEFCKLAVSLKPDAILMENVPDLFSDRHWPFFQKGRRVLEEAGYKVRAQVYNFAGFGLPQERFRAVVIAFKENFSMPEPFLLPGAYRTVRHAIGSLPAPVKRGTKGLDLMHVGSNHRESTLDILRKVPKDGGNRPTGVGPACLDRARVAHGGYTDVYGRLAWDKPAVTITARCRTPSCGRFAHPEDHRGLTIREAALLQGFPPGTQFTGPFDECFKQIGNAVPPLVARHLGEHMLEQLLLPGTGERNGADIVASIGPGFAVTINGLKRRRTAANKQI